MRAGRTKTTSFSLDSKTMSNLKALARRNHGGNVSALLADIAKREEKLLAAEAFFRKYGVTRLSEAQLAKVEQEWEAALASAPARKAPGRRAA
jgi:hypothetical protein